MKNGKQFYVYIYKDPRPGKNLQPFYVGKGSGSRMRMHLSYGDAHINSLMRRVLTKINKAGLKPIIELVRRFDIEAEAYQFEAELVAQYGRRNTRSGSLCNLTDGGEGGSGSLLVAKNGRERFLKLNADPEFVKARTERFKKLHADPELKRLIVNGSKGLMLILNLRKRWLNGHGNATLIQSLQRPTPSVYVNLIRTQRFKLK